MTDEFDETPEDAASIVAEAKLRVADPKPSLEDMMAEVGLLAAEIESGQVAFLNLNRMPSPHAMRRVVVLDAVYNFLEACRTRPHDVAARLNKQKAA